jgi:ABC-2 type transport system permease protein/lipopolysaccharide transport system permease protein
MSRAIAVAEAPPPELRYRRRPRLGSSIRELWGSRELIRSLAERDIRARYKQAVLGLGWALLTPLALMLVFTLVVQRVGHVDTGGVPYPLFAYVGLLPWTFFSGSLTIGGVSLHTDYVLINKVYCPREVFPIAGIMVAAVDGLVALGVLGVLFVATGFVPKGTVVWVPVLFAVQLAFTVGITVVTSIIVVYFRDLRHLIPILLQIGLFATPVAYGIQAIPVSVRRLYCAINPLAPVIDGYRRTVLQGLPPDWYLLAPAAVTSLVLLLGGYLLFKRLEPGIADAA